MTPRDFLEKYGISEYELVPIASDASLRLYYRIKVAEHVSQSSYIIMDAHSEPSSIEPFIRIDKILQAHGVLAPKIFAVENGFVLLEDLGEVSVVNHLETISVPRQIEIYKIIIELLCRIQQIPQDDSLRLYTNDIMMRELETFIDWQYLYMKGRAISDSLRKEYINIWRELFERLPTLPFVLVLRDFHAENLIYRDSGSIGVLDFQDAVWGHPIYDLASILDDVRIAVSIGVRDYMIEYYTSLTNGNINEIKEAYAILAAQRNSRIIGLFARKAIRDGQLRYLRFLSRTCYYLIEDFKLYNSNSMRDLTKWHTINLGYSR